MLLGGYGENVVKNGSQASDLDKWTNSSVSSPGREYGGKEQTTG